MAKISSKLNATIMLEYVKSWQQNGMSKTEYCIRHKINANKFEYWLHKNYGMTDMEFVSVLLQIMNGQKLIFVETMDYFHSIILSNGIQWCPEKIGQVYK
ncbi:MAG: IS66 family insertion sequence element accessory protein TnpA [Candidatus Ozemobacteraceae bacterium]